MTGVFKVLRDYYKVIVKSDNPTSGNLFNERVMKEMFDKCNSTNEEQITRIL